MPPPKLVAVKLVCDWWAAIRLESLKKLLPWWKILTSPV